MVGNVPYLVLGTQWCQPVKPHLSCAPTLQEGKEGETHPDATGSMTIGGHEAADGHMERADEKEEDVLGGHEAAQDERDVEEFLPSREQSLRLEAQSVNHMLTHKPKNPPHHEAVVECDRRASDEHVRQLTEHSGLIASVPQWDSEEWSDKNWQKKRWFGFEKDLGGDGVCVVNALQYKWQPTSTA